MDMKKERKLRAVAMKETRGSRRNVTRVKKRRFLGREGWGMGGRWQKGAFRIGRYSHKSGGSRAGVSKFSQENDGSCMTLRVKRFLGSAAFIILFHSLLPPCHPRRSLSGARHNGTLPKATLYTRNRRVSTFTQGKNFPASYALHRKMTICILSFLDIYMRILRGFIPLGQAKEGKIQEFCFYIFIIQEYCSFFVW